MVFNSNILHKLDLPNDWHNVSFPFCQSDKWTSHSGILTALCDAAIHGDPTKLNFDRTEPLLSQIEKVYYVFSKAIQSKLTRHQVAVAPVPEWFCLNSKARREEGKCVLAKYNFLYCVAKESYLWTSNRSFSGYSQMFSRLSIACKWKPHAAMGARSFYPVKKTRN